MIVEKERQLLETLNKQYEWIWKTHNCPMVSMEKPQLEGMCLNAPDRIELGGFQVDFDCLEVNGQAKLIADLLNTEEEMPIRLYNKKDMTEIKTLFANDAIIKWLDERGGPYTKVVISQNGLYISEAVLGIPFKPMD